MTRSPISRRFAFGPVPVAALVAGLLTVLAGASGLRAEPACGRLHILAVTGQVSVVRADGRSGPAETGLRLCAGDWVVTRADGQALLRLTARGAGAEADHGAAIRLDSSSTLAAPADGAEGPRLAGGALYFIATVRSLFTVSTDYVTAGIDGTEAAVQHIPGTGSAVWMREGRVALRQGGREVALSVGARPLAVAPDAQTLLRPADPAAVPPAFRGYLVNPDGAVDWTVHAPVEAIAPALARRAPEALAMIRGGRFAAAEAALGCAGGPSDDASAAACTLIAVALDRRERLAATVSGPTSDSAPGRLALSYARQALGDTEGARDAAAAAVAAAPGDAWARARLAETELLGGDTAAANRALGPAPEGCEAVPALDTMRGFAALAAGDRDTARRRLDCARQGDAFAPLPWFGAGLLAAREGDLQAARARIETALALDPRRAALRVWLGRAHAEAGEGGKAIAQYRLAQEADPDDPTPLLFEALERYRRNDPVGALRLVEAAEARGGRRATVRTPEGLGEDRAVRAAALGRVYDQLGFVTLQGIRAGLAPDLAPASPEARRLAADAARARGDAETVQLSEYLMADLLSPPSKTPVQPRLGAGRLALLDTPGPARVTFAEAGPLFDGDGHRFDFAATGGGQGTGGVEAAATVLHGNLSASLGGYRYVTDGFDDNDDLSHAIGAAKLHYAPSPVLTLFAEGRVRETEGGDRRLDLAPGAPATAVRIGYDQSQIRGGLRVAPRPGFTLLAYADAADKRTTLGSGPGRAPLVDLREEGVKAEAAVFADLGPLDLQAGGEILNTETDDALGGRFDASAGSLRGYAYLDGEFSRDLHWTLGAALERYDEDGADTFDTTELQPRLGLRWEAAPGVTLRAAYTETLSRRSIFPETLERTAVAGFAQYFDDVPGAEHRRLSAAIDLHPVDRLRLGLGLERRDIALPDLGAGRIDERIEAVYGYASLDLTDTVALSFDPRWERLDSAQIGTPDRVETLSLPVSLGWFHRSGLFAVARAAWHGQDAEDPVLPFTQTGGIVDAVLGYRLPGGRGVATLELRNLFDTDLALYERAGALGRANFETILLDRQSLSPAFSVLATFSLRF